MDRTTLLNARNAALLAGLCTLLPALSQPTWRRAYGALDNDEARSVRVWNAEVMVSVGSTGSFGAGASDIYVIAVDPDGTPLWSRTVGGPGVENATDSRVNAEGDLFICGFTNGTGDYDGLLVKMAPDGEVLWQRTYGGDDWDFLQEVQVLADGGLLLAGETYSNGNVAGSAWLVRTAADGAVIWEQAYGGATAHAARSAKPTLDGGFILAGSMVDDTDDGDALVIRTNGEGSELWRRTYGGDSTDVANDIIVLQGGGYSIVGSSRSFSEWNEAYHFKIDEQGEQLWSRHWGQVNDQEAYEHFELPSGEFMSIGYTKTSGGGGKDMFLLRSWIDGDFVYGRTFGGAEDEEGFSLALLPDGFLCGGSTRSFGSGGSDVFLVRTGADGTTATESVTDTFDPLTVAEVPEERQGLFPNPSTGTINLPVGGRTVAWRAVNSLGQALPSRSIAPGTSELDTELGPGAYVIELLDDRGHVEHHRLIIVRP